MKSARCGWLLPITLALLLPAAALADGHGGWTLTPGVTGNFYDSERDLDDAAGGRLGVGYDYGRRWGAELVAGFTPTEAEDADVDVNQLRLQLDGLYHMLPEASLQPYLVAGAGVSQFNPNRGKEDSDLQLNAGLGLRYLLGNGWLVRADVRDYYAPEDGEHDPAVMLGVGYLFAARAAAPMTSPPPEPPPRDSDNDGVLDSRDACPATPAGQLVDASGCPMDGDADGVDDAADRCPNTPAGAPVNSQGCALDSDGDGVADHLDQCPETPAGARVDEQGCRVALEEAVSIRLAVNFPTDSAQVGDEYLAEIRRVADFMREYPDTEAVIEGHTDSVGDAQYNQRLSQRRAEAVRQVLVERFGVAPRRVRAVGYGEARPVADNDTAGGRAQNRRVVAVLEATAQRTEQR